MSFARLTLGGRERLEVWLKDVLLDKSEVRAWVTLLEENLISALLDGDTPVVYVSKRHTRLGTAQELRFRKSEYEAEIDHEVDNPNVGVILEPLRWEDLDNENKVTYAASAAILTEMGGRFVVSGKRYERLLDAVKTAPLPVPIQKVLGADVSRPWRKFGKTVQHHQAPFLALHAFCEAHVNDFEVAWSRCAALLNYTLNNFQYRVTAEKSYMEVSRKRAANPY